MVKTTGALVLLVTLALSGCSSRKPVDLHPETLRVAEGGGGPVSLARLGGSLLGVFARRTTATLDAFLLPLDQHLPSSPPATSVVDVVDQAPPLSASFGRHLLRATGTTAMLLYQDRASADAAVLKLATRTAADGQWIVDVMDPPGDPLDVLPSLEKGLDVFWAAGGVLWRSLPGTVNALVLPGFRLSGQPADLGADGFAARNAADSSLYVVERVNGDFAARRLTLSSPVYSGLRSPDGAVSLLSWDKDTRRLVLKEESRSRGPLTQTVVTIADGTGSVVLLPGSSPGTYLFVFDEVRRRGGRTVHDVSLIAPSAALQRQGNGYGKAILFEGLQPIDAFAAVEAEGAVYVLVQSDALVLVRAPVPGAESPFS